MLRYVLLGTGTSTGVPSVGCDCATCTSNDARDQRLRTSLLIQSETTTVVIDTSADFRRQMLNHKVMHIDGIVYTHHHYDHISGFDDTRPYHFYSRTGPLKCYALKQTYHHIQQTFPYAFGAAEQLGGGLPSADFTIIDDEPFSIGDMQIIPIPLTHGKIRGNGYRIGNFAYCTDTNHIPDSSYALLEGLDILILDALRYHEHPTHFTIDQASEEAKKIQAKQTYFTHVAHQIKHAECQENLPEGCFLAYDNLEFTI